MNQGNAQTVNQDIGIGRKMKKQPEIKDLHQLLIDQNKIEKISAYYQFLNQMGCNKNTNSNRQDFWIGSLDATKTIIEILDIKNFLRFENV